MSTTTLEPLAQRRAMAAAVDAHAGPFEPRLLAALLAVPRERFVRPRDVSVAYEDHPLPLDDEGHATVSAPHAYLLSFRLAELGTGDSLLELGSGSGYGAALASELVGPTGHVRTVEIDPALATLAHGLLSICSNVETIQGDASEISLRGFAKTIVTYAVRALPQLWIDTLPLHGVLVAPIGEPNTNQRLVRYIRTKEGIVASDHGAVRYVWNRSMLP